MVVPWCSCLGLGAVPTANHCPLTAAPPLWETQFPGAIAALVADSNEQLYLKTQDSLVALSQKDGTILWQSPLDFRNAEANLAVTADYVAVGTTQQVIVFNAHTGEQLWQYRPGVFALDKDTPHSLVIGDTTLYVGFLFDNVMAFDLATGTVLWESTQPQPEHRAPNLVVNKQRVIVVKPERVYALNAQTGELEWQQPFEDMLYRPTLLDAEQVVVTGDQAMYSLNTTDGQMVWQIAAQSSQGAQGTVPAVVADGTVIWTNAAGQLSAAKTTTGDIVWQADTEADIIFAPLVVNADTVWVRTSFPAKLQGYDLKTGHRLFTMSLGNSWRQMLNPGMGPVIAGDRLFLTNARQVFACPVAAP